MSAIVCRTLRHEYRIHAPEAVVEDLRFIEIAPEIAGPALAIEDIEVSQIDGQLITRLPDGQFVEGSATHLLGALHGLILNDILAGEPGAPLVHGATVVIDGRRLLLVGAKGCGKSTLTLHLLAAGHRVEGDEHLVIRAEAVIARPRTLRIKPGTLQLVPQLADAVAAAPNIENWDGTKIWAVSPTIGGRRWTIAEGTLDAMVFLSANRGGRSVARPLSATQGLHRLMPEIMLGPTGIAAAAARLRQLAGSVPAFQLSLGDLVGAQWHLEHLAGLLTSGAKPI